MPSPAPSAVVDHRSVCALYHLWDPLLCTAAADPLAAVRGAFGFFTCWALAVHVAAAWFTRRGSGSTAPAVAWLRWWLAWGVAIGGGYVTFVHPRRLRLAWSAGRVLCVTGPALWLLDAAFHHGPCLWVIGNGRPPAATGTDDRAALIGGTLGAIALAGAYCALHDPRSVYGVDGTDVAFVLIATAVVGSVAAAAATATSPPSSPPSCR